MRFTDRTLAALLPPSRGQKIYTDDAVPGFGLRVGAKVKTFVLTLGADRHRITLGRYPLVSLSQARDRAKTILAERQLGITRAPSPTIAEVIDEFRASRDGKITGSTVRAYRRYAEVFVDSRRIGDLTTIDVEKIAARLSAPEAHLHGLIWLKGLFRFAEARDYIEKSPLKAVNATRRTESRERVLTPDQLAKVIATARLWASAGHHFGTIVELIVLTGQRRQQIGHLNRAYIDFDQNTITWPADLMKTKKRHTIPMGRAVRALLDPRVNGLYFPSRNATPFTAWDICLSKFRADCGFTDWRLHDLRRTLATCWQEMGIEIATTEKMLSHSAVTGGLVGIYQRSTYLTQMRTAVQRWEEYIQALLLSTEGANA